MGVLNKTTDEINSLLNKVDNMPDGGASGKTPVLETGKTTTLSAGDNATSEVVRDGEDASGNPKYKLNFGIPRGKDGTGGSGGGTVDSVDWDNVQNKPSWVNSGTKPGYTATEVGALPADTVIPSKVSELDNDSKFVKESGMKTVNGYSLVGSGNIEIAGSGGGITDAPSDGLPYVRKDGAWLQADMVNIADIIGNSNGDGTLFQEGIDKLKGYIESGKGLYIVMEGLNIILSARVDDSQILLMGNAPYGKDVMAVIWTIDLSTRILSQDISLVHGSDSVADFCLLNGYGKPSSYSPISAKDSINTAIGKLEAGLGGGSGDVYILPSAVLKLTGDSTSEEILTAFGGQSALESIFNAAKANKCFYFINLEHSISPQVMPASIIFQKISTLISVGISFVTPSVGSLPLTICEIELQGIIYKPTLKKREIYPKGYQLNSALYQIGPSSSSSDISTAVGGETGMKDIIKAVDDGNRFVCKLTDVGVSSGAEISIMYSIDSDNGNISICFSGIGYGLWGGMAGGMLVVEFNKISGVFSVILISLAIQNG